MYRFRLVLSLTLFVRSCCLISPMKTNSGETDVNSVATHVLLLEQMFSDIKTTINTMEIETASLKSGNAKLETTVKAMETEVTSLKSENVKLEQELAVVKGMVKNVNNTVEHTTSDVSFEARSHVDVNSGAGSTLRFGDIKQNIGGGYHSSSGIFTSPVNGTYIFWAHVMVGDGSSHRIDLLHGGKVVASGYSKGLYTVASLTSVVYVKRNDELWFVKQDGSLVIHGDNLSSYGGFLLSEH